MGESIPRTASSQAMQSLFSAYDEDEVIDDDMADDKISGSEDEAMGKPSPEPIAILKEITPKPSPQPKLERKLTKLVSYMADDANEEEDDDESNEDEDDENEAEGEKKGPFSLVDYNVSMTTTDLDTSSIREPSTAAVGAAGDDEVRLPPEPTGRCPKHLQAKIAGYYEKMLRSGLNLSHSIENRKDFRNPSIYEKLIHFVDIDEKGTNYPPQLYDPTIWGQESYFDHLAKFQKEEMDKREKDRKEKTKIEFVVGTKKLDGSDHKHRKSKWDAQPQGQAASKPPPPISAAGVATNPSLVSVTSAPSGTKTTVISAVGTLKKTAK